jgi:hypothetical protein
MVSPGFPLKTCGNDGGAARRNPALLKRWGSLHATHPALFVLNDWNGLNVWNDLNPAFYAVA